MINYLEVIKSTNKSNEGLNIIIIIGLIIVVFLLISIFSVKRK